MLNAQQYTTYKQIDNKNRSGRKQKPARMPKEQAQALSQKLKMATMAASIIAFGLFGGLIAPELQRSTATQATSTQTKSSSATGSQSTSGNAQTPFSSDSQSNSSSGQQQDGGYSFGNSGSSTTPGTSTHVS